MPQKSYNKECKLFLLAFGKKNLTVTLKKGRKKATIKKANYFYTLCLLVPVVSASLVHRLDDIYVAILCCDLLFCLVMALNF